MRAFWGEEEEGEEEEEEEKEKTRVSRPNLLPKGASLGNQNRSGH